MLMALVWMLCAGQPVAHPVDKVEKRDAKTEAAVAVAQARLKVTKADEKISEVEVRKAQDQFQRYRGLYQRHAISAEAYEIAEQRFVHAQANHERNLARVKEAEALVEYAKVHGVADTVLTSPRETVIWK